MEIINLDLTLEEIENNYWGEPDYLSSVVINSHKNRKIPLNKLSSEQIRLLIVQDIGTIYLLPLALNILKENPYTECDFYPCDLLLCVMENVNKKYWIENTELYNELTLIIELFNKNFKKENIERVKGVDKYDAISAIINDETKNRVNNTWDKLKNTIGNKND